MTVLTLHLKAAKGAADIIRVELESVLLELAEEFVEEHVAGLKAVVVNLILSQCLHHANALVLAKRTQLRHLIDILEDPLRSVIKTHQTRCHHADVLIDVRFPLDEDLVLDLAALARIR